MSERGRYLLMLLSLCLSLVTGLVLPGYLKIRDLETQEAGNHLNYAATVVRADITRVVDILENSGVDEIASYVGQSKSKILDRLSKNHSHMRVEVIVFDRYGKQLLDTSNAYVPEGSPGQLVHVEHAGLVLRTGELDSLMGGPLEPVEMRTGNGSWLIQAINEYNWGWRIIIGMSHRDVYRKSMDYLQFVLGIALGMLALVSVLYLVLGSRIARRVNRLRMFILGFNNDTLKHRLPDDRNDEIGKLQKALNAMADRIENESETRKEAEQRMEAARYEAEAASQAKSLFLAKMSHEMRNPLNAIVGFSALLNQATKNEEATGLGNRIIHASRNLQRTVEDILDLTKIERGILKLTESPFDLHMEINQAVESIQLQNVPDSVSITCHIAEDVPREVIGDSLRIAQIIINLLENSVKHTGEGYIRLHASVVDDPAHELVVQLAVSDSGTGIDEKIQKCMFDEFQQGGRSDLPEVASAGLGLSIVRNIVNAMEGEIRVTSVPGTGTEFIVFLPLGKVTESTVELPASKIVGRGGLPKELSVLVAEDDMLNREYIVQVLSGLDISHQVARDGIEALARMREKTFDVLLLDMRMPNMDGKETINLVRNHMPSPACDIPIIVLSANAFPEQIENYITLGADACLAKPFDAETLVATLVEIVNGGSNYNTDRRSRASN